MDATEPADRPGLIYVGDPMCSWCWGFAPAFEQLVARHDLRLRILVGGLRPGPAAQPLAPQLRGFLLHHWEQVEQASGQPFDRSALEARPGTWRYDTEPAGAAVVTMRRIAPDQELAYFVRLQRAFYAEGDDITRPDVLADLAADVGVPAGEFAASYAETVATGAVNQDFADTRRLGVSGFPTTLLDLGGRLRMLAAGYQPYEQVDQILHAALDRFAPEAAVGAACSVDGAR